MLTKNFSGFEDWIHDRVIVPNRAGLKNSLRDWQVNLLFKSTKVIAVTPIRIAKSSSRGIVIESLDVLYREVPAVFLYPNALKK